MPTNISSFSDRLRQLCEVLQVEHQMLARAGGVSKATLSNYIHGEKFPRMETIANWIDEYGINANWLISGHGAMFLDGKAREKTVSPSDDPVIERMQAAVSLLQQANAPDAVIQNAVLAALNTPHSPS